MEHCSYNKQVPKEYDCSGEQRLCMAVIIQAVKDVHYSKEKREILGGKLPQRSDKEAIRWIKSNSNAPFSFLWCLEHAFPEVFEDLDIDKLRQIVLSKPLLCNSVTMFHQPPSQGRKSLSLYIK